MPAQEGAKAMEQRESNHKNRSSKEPKKTELNQEQGGLPAENRKLFSQGCTRYMFLLVTVGLLIVLLSIFIPVILAGTKEDTKGNVSVK